MESNFRRRCSEKFKLGTSHTSLSEILGEETINKLELKFDKVSEDILVTTIRELLRYLFLTAYSPTTVFFPGDRLMDDVWHALILETADYRSLCNRIAPSTFLEHSGVKFEDYTSKKSPEESHEEQFSWLASYYFNFGVIEPSSFRCLKLAQSIAERLNIGIDELNRLSTFLVSRAGEASKQIWEFSLENFLNQNITPFAPEIDRDPLILGRALRSLIEASRPSAKANFLLKNCELEQVFGSSTALAFTFWQHLAAVERLCDHPSWQKSNEQIWRDLASARKLIGLATTHLARPEGSPLIGSKVGEDFVVSGSAPWSSGYRIFDYLLVGFEAEEETIFALIEYPNPTNASSVQGISIFPYNLNCMNGTSSIRMEFQNRQIKEIEVVSRTHKSNRVPRKSIYKIPQLGIAKSAVSQCERTISERTHPKNKFAESAISEIRKRITSIEEMRSSEDYNFDDLIYNCDEVNRDAVRILALTQGGAALLANSPASRMHAELLLLDAVIQSSNLLERKITQSGRK